MASDNDTMRAWRVGEIDANTALLRFTPLIKRLARWASNRYNIPGHQDDLQQELSIALMGDAGSKWNPDQPISSYLAGWAWRIASSLKQTSGRDLSFNEIYITSESDFLRGEGDQAVMDWGGLLVAEEHTPEYFAEAAIQNDVRKTALASISLTDLDAEISRLEANLKPKKSSQSAEQKRRKRKTDMNERLLSIRSSLGLTRPEMAGLMAMSFARYTAYESGKTLVVPDDVYDRAKIAIENAASRVRISDEIAGLSMSQVITLWQGITGMQNPMEIAKLLDVSPRTMRRWLSNEYIPRRDIVVGHHAHIRSLFGRSE